MKKIIRSAVLLVLLSFTATQVAADWTGCRIFEDNCVDYEIGDIFSKVNKVNSDLLKNRPVLDHYLKQQKHWDRYKDNTGIITDGIVDILEKLQPVRDKFQTFVGSPKCASGTDCHQFQNELIGFFDELTGLNQKFPAFEKAGLNDKDLVAKAILATPPFMLYALYRGMKNIPDWESLPKDLAEIYDEIDDPEVFLMGWKDSISSSISNSTKTQRFCARRADKFDGTGRGRNGNRDGWDQIRINRITLFLTLVADVWSFGLDQVPDDIDIGVSLVGEGGTLGIPSVVFTWMFKIVPIAMNSVLKATDVHHKNIDLCKSRFEEVEGRLSRCGYFAEFVLDETARGEYYNLVDRRFEMADVAGISHSKSDRFMSTSQTKLAAGQYDQAYENLCSAYKFIGVAR